VSLINDLVPLALFVALMLAASLYGLAVSGHFPRRQKETAFASAFGATMLFGSVALMIAALAGGIIGALHLTPWYAAIIGGGFALLFAPLVLRGFSDRFVDGRGAPLAFAGLSAGLALLLIWLAVSDRCAVEPQAHDQTTAFLGRDNCR
jgi:hypothetical protein